MLVAFFLKVVFRHFTHVSLTQVCWLWNVSYWLIVMVKWIKVVDIVSVILDDIFVVVSKSAYIIVSTLLEYPRTLLFIRGCCRLGLRQQALAVYWRFSAKWSFHLSLRRSLNLSWDPDRSGCIITNIWNRSHCRTLLSSWGFHLI